MPETTTPGSDGHEEIKSALDRAGDLLKRIAEMFGKPAEKIVNSLPESQIGNLPAIALVLLGFFAGGTQTGRSIVVLGYNLGEAGLEKFRKITKCFMTNAIFFFCIGVPVYIFALMFGNLWHQSAELAIVICAISLPVLGIGLALTIGRLKPAFWITIGAGVLLTAFCCVFHFLLHGDATIIVWWGGFFAALGVGIFFTYVVGLQWILRKLSGEKAPAFNVKDPISRQLREQWNSVRGAFAKGILWVDLFMLLAIRYKPWMDLEEFVIFILSMFALLLVKDSSARGRAGLATVGHYVEVLLLALAAMIFLVTWGSYTGILLKQTWPNGYEKSSAWITWASDNTLGHIDVLNRSDSLKTIQFALADLDSNGYVDKLDTALANMWAIGDINGSGGPPDSADLKAFSMYYVLDMSLGPKERSWTLYVTVGPHEQSVGDVNGDFEVTLEDSVYLERYLQHGGRAPIYQLQTAFVSAKYPTQTNVQEEPAQYAVQQPALEAPRNNGRRSGGNTRSQLDRGTYAQTPSTTRSSPYIGQRTIVNVPAANYKPVFIGEVPSYATLYIEACGEVNGAGLGLVTGPKGNNHLAGGDPNKGIPDMNHGELYLVISQAGPGSNFQPPPVVRRLNWFHQGNVWRAEITLPDQGGSVKIGFHIRDSKYSDNGGGFTTTVDWIA